MSSSPSRLSADVITFLDQQKLAPSECRGRYFLHSHLDMSYSPTQETFLAASTWLSSTPSAASQPNEVKLEVQHWLCQKKEARPSMFSLAARAKYDAWVAQAAKYDALEAARQRYIVIAAQIGWSGEGLDDSEENDIDDEEDGSEDKRRRDKGKKKEAGIMGKSVSVMVSHEHSLGIDGDAKSPIHEAVIDESLEEVKTLLANSPSLLDAKDEFGYTPLHLAADRGFSSIVEYLLSIGAKKEARDEDGQTALELAQISDRKDIVELLR
ncbi:hypothetical protein P7C73_g1601, partial [Tremellales sp. Uapishka_1]